MGSRAFWILVAVLLSASVFFALNAEQRRREAQKSDLSLHSGELVHLQRVIDGDTLVVVTEGGETSSVRVLGIKAFDPIPDKQPTSHFGKAAVYALTELARSEPIRVLLHETPKDDHGRILASLFVAERDLGLSLVQQGLALVYPVYPFATMTLYLQEQEAARAGRLGLWSDPEVARRADLLLRQWRKRAE